ncbi:glycosyltransferase family 4 protein [Bizionia sediminis]|uniref:Glycosyltransferase family 4 protein n=1 Tax=Bizionia sediminis TaxID=1737064 RepID=A0ABW5KPP3_9FLAO
MVILHISYASTWGGGEQQMIDLIHALNDLGIKNPLVCFKNSALHKYVVKNNLDFVSIETKNLKSLQHIIKNSEANLLHIHTGSFIKDFILLNIFYGLSIPCVYTINGIMRKKSFMSRLKYNYSKIDAIHFVSNAAKNHFKNEVAFKKSYKKLHTIYDGIQVNNAKLPIDTNVITNLSNNPDAFFVGNVANHTRAKNLISFIETAKILVHDMGMKNLKFVQIGRESKLTEPLNQAIIDYDLSNHVFLLGFIENAQAYISLFDTLLITSNREGLPLTIMEAFKHNVPVVSTDAGGIPEAIETGENGFLSPINDHKGLALQILELRNNKQLAVKFATRSQAILQERFTANKMGENTLKLYNSILHGN